MFGKRGGILSALAAVGLLSSAGVVAQIAQIPAPFSEGFDKGTELKVTFQGKTIKDGDVLSPSGWFFFPSPNGLPDMWGNDNNE